ncbi:MAG: hypothetical protein K0Q43_2124 [Ramlibacter sp.]|jgi:hypothetical protein|nr:hypothetical protein [Ramlibacter sp.]
METRYYDPALRIDHEVVKAHALALRNEAIDSSWRQLVSKVSGLIDGLRLNATSPSGQPGKAHFDHRRHRLG